MNHADDGAALAFDARMRSCMDEVAHRELGFALGCSAGIAIGGQEGDVLETVLKHADATLYRAKAQGRDQTLDAHGCRLPTR